MSGLEVAGLVLGALPVAVKVLQGYTSVLSSVKNIKRDLHYLERDLKTERIRLQNTCETLLVGIVPPSMIDSMIDNPFGDEWKRYADDLKVRLWRSSSEFEAVVAEMMAATQALNEKLCIKQDGSTELNDRVSILRELQRRATFTLKKSDYDSILSRIKQGNSVLQDLARQDCNLEPDRKHRSQARVTKLLRGLCRSIYTALCGAVTCSCVNHHQVGLELAPRSAVLVPGDLDEQVAKKFEFHVAINSVSVADSDDADDQDISLETQQSAYHRHWNSLQVRLAESDKKIASPAASTPMLSQTKSLTQKIKWAPSVQFVSRSRSSSSAVETLVQNTTSLTISTSIAADTAPQVSNLCQVIHKGQKKAAVDCYGFVLDSERKFMLYPPKKRSDIGSAMTLREVLAGSDTTLPPFGYPERLEFALALSISVLHLYETPWLAQAVTLDDIVFLRGVNAAPVQACSPYRPFVTKTISHQATSTAKQSSKAPNASKRHINVSLLSLGALLTQIICGEAIEALRITADMDMNSIIAMRMAAKQLEDRILENGGTNYAAAVNWCFESVYAAGTLQKDEFCQSFYEAVVARLEQDTDFLQGD